MNLTKLNSSNTVHVEVRLHRSEQRIQTIRAAIEKDLEDYLRSTPSVCWNATFSPSIELQSVQSILLEKDNGDHDALLTDLAKCEFCFHFYMTQRPEMHLDTALFSGEGDEDNIDSVVAANHVLLPAQEFAGLWENLIYEPGLKEKLLKFALSALNFSQHGVNSNVIACNRLILLHGPPGTGKTSLSKAIAQKLSIRMQGCFAYTHLIEINSHSLFSKWFSESGKLVASLFLKIRELLADKHNLVCVLIDEVESLAYARSAMSSNEPRDAMRVVNAVLTQLDEIKSYSNVLVLATSNLAQSIDMAFLDRADIRQFIGFPAAAAIKSIYTSMLQELMDRGILINGEPGQDAQVESLLTTLATNSIGLSGRTLRKMPLLAHAHHMNWNIFELQTKIGLLDFLQAMHMALDQHLQEQQELKQENL
ncbi:pch2 [Drosophila busckii]|uniref:Pch2 n=1 Tax=Drosophila busckii TaxID=30019 RepID=A0A0M3QXX3_DROBS|nr:pachytene checkpoint protein 2 homolog [Drosophila busckii]ALC46673.1 pch2 [Drosophila busckii]